MVDVILILALCALCFWLGFKTSAWGIKILIRKGELRAADKFWERGAE